MRFRYPYGVRTRVIKVNDTKYFAQYSIVSGWFGIFTSWDDIKNRRSNDGSWETEFAASLAAQNEYDNWVAYYEKKNQAKLAKKSKKRRKTVFELP